MTPVAQAILSSLLGKGYFPKELPSVFTTTSFGEHAADILAEWEGAKLFAIKKAKEFPNVDGKRLRGRYGYKSLNHAEPEIISKPKKLYERRNIHITHPIPQALLVKEIADNWRQIQRFLSKRQYSEDQIVIADKYERSVKGINFPLHRAKKSYIEATADWLVRTDISRFYPSIYTHSIPWASYGKERVKSNLKFYDGSLADRLDVLVRACNRNQTIGIPIGPETSRILAEIISSRIDCEYASALCDPRRETIDRLQDDWVVGARSLEHAEKILSVISACYRGYGLDINGSKTSVTHILASDVENWKSEIAGFLSHRSGGLHGGRLEEFLNLCLRLQLASPGAPVMNYALSIVEGRRYPDTDVQVLESFLLKAAAIAPSSMDRICRIILNIAHSSGGLSTDRLVRRFKDLAERHFANGALFEVIWILYTIRGLKKPLNTSKIMEYAEHCPSSAVRLVLMDMKAKGICASKLPLSTWEGEICEERILADWSWLYAYEAIRKGWMKDPKGLLSTPFFKAMNQRDVVFYDPTKNVKNSKAVKMAQFAIRKQQNLKVNEFLNNLRGINPPVDLDWLEY